MISYVKDQLQTFKKPLVFAGSLLVTVIFAFPIYWWLITSLKPFGTIFTAPPVYLIEPIFSWYKVILGLIPYSAVEAGAGETVTGEGGGAFYVIPFLINSLIISSCSTIGVLIIATPAAYGFARFNFIGQRDTLLWVLSTRMFPPIAVVYPIFSMYQQTNLLDTHVGLIALYISMNLALAIFILRSFIIEIPEAVEEAAFVDGLNRLQTFFKVVLPLIKPGMAATAILTFVFSWNEFLFAVSLTSTGTWTIPVVASSFVTSYGTEWGMLAALGTIGSVPALVLLFFTQKYLVRGLSMGAVKY